MNDGTILTAGNFWNLSTWEVTSQTPKTILLTRLEWSSDLLNERGVMFRTSETLRIKPRADTLIYNRKYGTFESIGEPREVRDRVKRPAASS